MKPWTAEELVREWRYIYDERVGMLLGRAPLTLAADAEAVREADNHIAKLQLEPQV